MADIILSLKKFYETAVSGNALPQDVDIVTIDLKTFEQINLSTVGVFICKIKTEQFIYSDPSLANTSAQYYNMENLFRFRTHSTYTPIIDSLGAPLITSTILRFNTHVPGVNDYEFVITTTVSNDDDSKILTRLTLEAYSA